MITDNGMYPKEYFKITVVHTFLLYSILGPSDIKVFGREQSFTAASDWPRSFLHPRCFCLAYNYSYIG